ncbi:hypothetical protein CI109_103842 [Kwoniella shandongensis]|uniref:Uncharacterized protein n=1 Tax=Kwoniella shandongensis TaxID=1734106 RepID=A0A5M6CAV0_9TREE|nr:uncharacterized protein CI109_000462 [Kwoniella shandongensis]KAA5530892.1 hypothetical protein CI109_000462 [Kwoniella shandongensis]
MSSPHVLIIGAGVGGPALAIAAAQHGIRCTIFELRSSPGTKGGSIMLQPNARRVLDKVIGIPDEMVGKEGFEFDSIDFWWEDGMKIGSVDMSDGGYRSVRIKREIVQRILLQKCAEAKDLVEIRYGMKLEKIKEDKGGVTAYFENGTEVRGNILIGADGIHSKVREHVLGDLAPTPTYSGMVGLGSALPRSLIPLPSPMTYPSFIYTPSGMIMVVPNDPLAQEIGFAAQRSEDQERTRQGWEEYKTSGGLARAIKNDYKDVTTQPVRAMMDNMIEDKVSLWAPYEIPDLETWHTDRVCLMGDAAHAIPPSGGQGAGQALEDAGFMSRLLAAKLSTPSSTNKDNDNDAKSSSTTVNDIDYAALFAHFEKIRKARFESVRTLTKNSGDMRRAKSSFLSTMFRKYSMKVWFTLQGGYYKNDAVLGYDVAAADITY